MKMAGIDLLQLHRISSVCQRGEHTNFPQSTGPQSTPAGKCLLDSEAHCLGVCPTAFLLPGSIPSHWMQGGQRQLFKPPVPYAYKVFFFSSIFNSFKHAACMPVFVHLSAGIHTVLKGMKVRGSCAHLAMGPGNEEQISCKSRDLPVLQKHNPATQPSLQFAKCYS